MEQPQFVFLNTMGGSSLSRPAVKRMRAHITKSNFAKRRRAVGTPQRAIENLMTIQENNLQPSACSNKSMAFDGDRTIHLHPALTCPEPARDPKALQKLQKLVYLEGIRSPVSPNEAAWFNLIASDPALIESTMAIAVRLWSPDENWQIEAYQHSDTALNLIKRRLESAATSTDGVLGAVATMALGASLENDDIAWNIHIDGLVQILKERKLRSTDPPPPWLSDLVVLDSVNAVFDFPRLYHESVVETLADCNDQRISRIKVICDSVIQVRQTISSQHSRELDSEFIAREIEEPLANLHHEVRALRAVDDSYVQATARSMELVLYLLWPSQSGAHLTLLASELKDIICQFPFQGCSYMNLTSFQLMIGAIAASENSPTRRWFVDRMAGEVRAMQLRGWNEPLSLLTNRNLPTKALTGRLQALWEELYHRAAELKEPITQ
ncbi:uncharacterized protein N7477_006942 [Penicillium maclennaniae]|uniref:uncharacterized protein n=1 Tax=Penicillium maclennaniae TaxID=1343394 RepID=UPI002540FCAA|nr:uncharacterized protein N7477_006942 [Penicillium maclennaniae]KAJ5668372.1 hypothetical protein N7477_006942 [Penicillium maclennaniae]